ncbi:hypothetical protein EV385_0798 [Krasilnikovia cinnamomea]|uniref:HD domain-containing protein n=1 Tax=Krasilnikovia cinnamomea TaxID=349313 RepID=A0A4Q7ZFY9_9ACTN|nr:hypothetical protein [Krasilnikovia cinnamomea]RZU49063.1 hypothetical protein EV385_0798 [Krasilnikovia cinnamomea]
MGAPSLPRTPLVTQAITLARQWCQGHVIDGSPAIGHALKVARKVVEHLPDAPESLLAAVILHDAPYFAPKDLDLGLVLTDQLNPRVVQIVRAIQEEHDCLHHAVIPGVNVGEPDVIVASAADKVVSIGAILRRAQRHPTPAAYWMTRQPFVDRVPYFGAFATAAGPILPMTLAEELKTVVGAAYAATRHAAKR